VAINVQLVARPAGALERPPSVDANMLAGPAQRQTLIHIWEIGNMKFNGTAGLLHSEHSFPLVSTSVEVQGERTSS